jgi:hypothetical protein
VVSMSFLNSSSNLHSLTGLEGTQSFLLRPQDLGDPICGLSLQAKLAWALSLITQVTESSSSLRRRVVWPLCRTHC